MIENLPPGRPVAHPDVAARIVAGEAVVLSPNQHMVRMLNEVGTRIWELADGTRTPADIAVQLTEEYAVLTTTSPALSSSSDTASMPLR